jgi:hypothetical protein
MTGIRVLAKAAHDDLETVMKLSGDCFPLLKHGHPARPLLGDLRALVRRSQERLAELAEMADR